MEERFPYEFVTWDHKTPLGVKVNEIFGMDSKSGSVWMHLARQIYAEQDGAFYRVINHFENGAPFLEGSSARISLTHTQNFLAVASLPKTPEVNLKDFSPRAALGIDAEPFHRKQVVKVRNKFLSNREQDLIPENNLIKNIQAWTIKEALYKAALCPGIDFKENLQIISLPGIALDPMSKEKTEFGEAKIIFQENSKITPQEMIIYSYESYGCCVSIAVSPKAAKFGK